MYMFSEWCAFLYDCNLEGQLWLHVHRVSGEYMRWRLGISQPPAFAADPANADLRLAELLREQHYEGGAVLSVVSEENIKKIISMLHFIVSEELNLN
jgi:hypothetical protein